MNKGMGFHPPDNEWERDEQRGTRYQSTPLILGMREAIQPPFTYKGVHMNQKQHVVAIITALQQSGLTGEALRDAAVAKVAEGLADTDPATQIPWGSGDRSDPKDCKGYAGGVVSNYFKKEKSLNGGVDYVPANPRGPRDTDEKIIELKKSLATLEAQTSTPEITALIDRVKAALDTRRSEIKASKATKEVRSMEETMEILAKLNLVG